MKLYRTLLAVAICATLLTACGKTDAPKAEEQPTNVKTTQASAETTSVNLDNSPSIAMISKIWQMSTVRYLAQSTPNITDEQVECLISEEAKATYHEMSKQTLLDDVDTEVIQEADNFYQSEVGQKMLKSIEQQEKLARGEPIDGEPIVLTEADEAKLLEMGLDEANQKLEAAMRKNMTPEKMMALIEDFTAKEKVRCNIG